MTPARRAGPAWNRSISPPRIAVVVLTFNQREKTLACLANLLEIRRPSFRAVLWDNGSEDGTVDAVRERLPQVLAHRNPENLGVAGGRNAGAALAIREFDPSHLLFLDNDMRLEPEFVAGLYEPFTLEPNVGQTQAKLRFMADPERLNDGGGARIIFWLARTEPVGYGEVDRGQRDALTDCIACGGAMMVRRDVFEQLGGFDESFNPMGPEDLDFSLRLRRAGYRAVYAPGAVAYHEVTHTIGANYDPGWARLKARNWFRFMRRHASAPEMAAFLLVGAPFLLARAGWREARRGNARAIFGLLAGGLDHVRSIATGSGKG